MVYLTAVLLPLLFLYSPKVEKSGPVFLTKTMTISQERQTPAYTAFQYAQKVSNVAQKFKENNLIEKQREPAESVYEQLSAQNLQNKNTITLNQAVFDKKSLAESTDRQLQDLIRKDEDSVLLTQLRGQMLNYAKSTHLAQQSSKEAAIIRGHFELVDGLAIINQRVTLKRVLEGQTIEMGQVDLNKGLYQIAVSSFEGDLIAEIKDDSGLIIGEDAQKILGLSRVKDFFQGPTLKVGLPSTLSLNARTYDESQLNESQFSGSLFSRNYALKKTTDIYPNVARHSSTIGFLESLDHKTAPMLTLRTTQDKSHTLVFSNRWVNAVQDYLSEQLQIQYHSESGFIIGRIIQDGKPLLGAQVVVENQIGLEPFYLNSLLIPEQNQSSTAKNGLFVIPGVRPGAYQISAYVGDKYLGTQMYFVESQVVSYQEVVVSNLAKSNTIRSFDAFSNAQAATDLQVPGFEEIIAVDSDLVKYRNYSQSGLMEIMNRPAMNEYIPYIYVQNLKRDYLHLPQISQKFIDYVKEQSKNTDLPDTSTFIGFVQAKKYKVYLADDQYPTQNIIYFDAQGRLSATPVPNGGFIALNIPFGSQEFVVENLENGKTGSQVFYSRPDLNFLSHFEE